MQVDLEIDRQQYCVGILHLPIVGFIYQHDHIIGADHRNIMRVLSPAQTQ